MTEESTPLETTAGTEMPLEDTLDINASASPADGEEAPPLDSVVEPTSEHTVDASEEIADTSQSVNDIPPNSEVVSLKAQLEDVNGRYMRLAADFDNFRKRTAKEKTEFEANAKRQTIIELLPVIDNFERARSQIKPQSDAENTIQKSYQGIYKQLVDSLKQLGVAPMRPEGEPFDPNLHEAVMRESTAEHPEGTVIEELRRGYLLGEQVLRHAMVSVAAPPEESDSSDEGQTDPEANSES